jgi:hypothetical protein
VSSRLSEADLSAVDPLTLAAYLAGQGWSVTNRTDRAVVAERSVDGQAYEVLLPLVRELRDYRLRIAQLLNTVGAAEGRDAQAVLNNVLLSADLVRLVVDDDDTKRGTVSLERAPVIFDNARSLVMAAACSVLEKRAVHPNRKPPQAIQFIKDARMGQTERGSYVVTVAAPVPRVETIEEASFLFPELDLPFGRKVTTTLQSALVSAKRASQEFRASGRPDVFEHSVEQGVSANLCESLVGMARTGASAISVEIVWSRVRPLDVPVGAVTIEPAEIPALEAAAHYFHTLAPDEGFILTGWVTDLHRGQAQDVGDVTVHGMTDAGIRDVRVSLRANDYEVAIVAHRDRRVISCIGTLTKQGARYRLDNPHTFQLLEGAT